MAGAGILHQSLSLLRALLDNTDVVIQLSQHADASDLTDRQRSDLQKISNRLNPRKQAPGGRAGTKRTLRQDTGHDHTAQGFSSEAETAPVPIRHTEHTDNDPRNDPWRSFRSLQSLPKPDFVINHLQGIRSTGSITRAQILMGDYFTDLTQQVGTQLGRYQDREEDIPNAFLTRYQYMEDIRGRSQLDNVRRCFGWLMWYDVVKSVRPNIRGTRLGRLVRNDMRNFLQHILPHENDEIKVNLICSKLDDWCKNGQKIHHLVKQCRGLGAIFFLADKLSESFIRSKMTQSGKFHDGAMKHLQDTLSIATAIHQEPFGTLAVEIRQLMNGSFRKHLQSYMHNHVRGQTDDHDLPGSNMDDSDSEDPILSGNEDNTLLSM